LNDIRAMMVPLSFRVGVKGKVVSVISVGLPVAAILIAAEGIGLTQKNILISKDPNAFAVNVADIVREYETLE
jgi:hypothetical protein